MLSIIASTAARYESWESPSHRRAATATAISSRPEGSDVCATIDIPFEQQLFSALHSLLTGPSQGQGTTAPSAKMEGEEKRQRIVILHEPFAPNDHTLPDDPVTRCSRRSAVVVVVSMKQPRFPLPRRAKEHCDDQRPGSKPMPFATIRAVGMGRSVVRASCLESSFVWGCGVHLIDPSLPPI